MCDDRVVVGTLPVVVELALVQHGVGDQRPGMMAIRPASLGRVQRQDVVVATEKEIAWYFRGNMHVVEITGLQKLAQCIGDVDLFIGQFFEIITAYAQLGKEPLEELEEGVSEGVSFPVEGVLFDSTQERFTVQFPAQVAGEKGREVFETDDPIQAKQSGNTTQRPKRAAQALFTR